MEVWHFWAIAALILVIGEIFTAGFALICIAIGAVAGAIAAGVGCSLELQIVWFSAGTLAAFLGVRPLLLRFSRGKSVPTNADALIGRTATVSETIDAETGTGRVAIDGDDWKAVSENGEHIDKGQKVTVIARDSIILTVKKA